MRFRVSVAVVTGALAATALAAPAATAVDQPTFRASSKGYASHPGDQRVGDTRITSVVINGGKPVVLGISATKKVSVTMTARDNSGIAKGSAVLWRGTDPMAAQDLIEPDKDPVSCTNKGTTGTCKFTFTVDPIGLSNDMAGGGWKLGVSAHAKDRNGELRWNYKSTSLQRFSKLTVDAAPEPVKKGANLTVTGALTRANWDDLRYAGYSAQPVKLQFRAKNAKTYTTVKTVRTDASGKLKTTVKASADGYYRYSFDGTSTTPAIKAGGDFVDVR
ncbi:hypothetical protein [Streptomyces yaizuensis]|uniref:DUF5707 domain-containing protein n=1 Tax=Streptomyces yaizuensis TaxID=2989713 RepID=A0ABQ5PA36_9ACTN|nr:hypothetical protein [Streptomyces sp. YSPA8]GLF99407.1 DUF5707 domain-containing protein [Streptomyces sp. YSPA8]